MQAELIGHEKDGRRDEAKRAALHAQWQEAQDEEAVQRLLKGVRHGFRSRPARHSALDDEVRQHCCAVTHTDGAAWGLQGTVAL